MDAQSRWLWSRTQLTGALRSLVIALSLSVGFAGLAYAFAPAAPGAVPDASPGAAPALEAAPVAADRPRVALMALESNFRWGTRIVVDRVNRSVVISRELVHGLAGGAVEAGDALLIPDESEMLQVSTWDRSFTVDDMEVRIALKRHGPTEAFVDMPETATEITVWVNGQARLLGFLEGSWGSGEGVAHWDRIGVYRRGGLLSTSAVRGTYPRVERGLVNGDLSTDRPWILLPAEAFSSPWIGDEDPLVPQA